MPLANALLTEADLGRVEETYPLDLAFCPTCALVQITETVPPEKLFREYLYFSSFSESFLRHAEVLAERLVAERRLSSEHLVVELASNDGYLLQYYKARGVPVLGIEPAANVARVAESERGIPTVCDFFSEGLARQLLAAGRRADVLHAHNVLAHVADLNGFVEGMRLLLKDDGLAVIEVPYVRDMIDRSEFDTIYHEHLCYFSATSVERLLRSHGLALIAVERLPVHGGSLRLFAMPAGRTQPDHSINSLLGEETMGKVDDSAFYECFAGRVESIRVALRSLIERLVGEGRCVVGYGAAAKATVLVNFLGLGRELLDFVVDRSPHKQGRYIPGRRLPIYPPHKIIEAQPDYVLLLAWNLAEEILAQQAEYRRRGGRFIIPIPEVVIV